MSDWITPTASAVTALATMGLAGIAWYQFEALREQLKSSAEQLGVQGDREKQWRTIDACERYVYDPVFREAKRAIWEARDKGRLDHIPDPLDVRQDVYILLNYFDGVGVGVKQGVYLSSIVEDHLKVVVSDAVDHFVKRGWGDFQVNETNIPGLMHLYATFSQEPAHHHATI